MTHKERKAYQREWLRHKRMAQAAGTLFEPPDDAPAATKIHEIESAPSREMYTRTEASGALGTDIAGIDLLIREGRLRTWIPNRFHVMIPAESIAAFRASGLRAPTPGSSGPQQPFGAARPDVLEGPVANEMGAPTRQSDREPSDAHGTWVLGVERWGTLDYQRRLVREILAAGDRPVWTRDRGWTGARP